MKLVNKLFWKGLIVVLPVTISIYIFISVFSKAENLFGNWIKDMIGPNYYIPGLGILLTLFLIILVGILVSNFLTGSIINLFINQFERTPFIKAIYNPLRDLMSLFGGAGQDKMKKVVLVKFDHLGFETIGLVTREEFDDIPMANFEEQSVAVYIPMSYMLGGFTGVFPRSAVREVNMPVEKALKLAITGWIKIDKTKL